MGVNVNKMIGYGLTNVGFDKQGNLSDDRFYELGWMMSDWEERERTWEEKDFLKFLRTKKSDISYGRFYADWIEENNKKSEWRSWHVEDAVVHRSEFGLANTLCIIPPENYKRWARYDDSIDFYEETIWNKQGNRVERLDRPIYPYESWIDKRDGRILKQPYITQLLRIRNSIRDDGWFKMDQSLIQPTIILQQLCATAIGFENYHDFLDNAKPCVPDTVLWLCEWLNLFSDPATAFQLEPMIYVYWE